MAESNQTSTRAVSPVPTSVQPSPTNSLDLSWLPEDKLSELLIEHSRALLELKKKAHELHVDVCAPSVTLGTLADTAQRAAENEQAVTVSHRQTSNAGQTEILMGNSGKAPSGKLSKSQTGERDWTQIYAIAGIVVLIFIASAFGK